MNNNLILQYYLEFMSSHIYIIVSMSNDPSLYLIDNNPHTYSRITTFGFLESIILTHSSNKFPLSSSTPLLFPAEENGRSDEHTSELQSHFVLVYRLLLEKKKLVFSE